MAQLNAEDTKLSAEDTKLIVLARAARARVGADAGAAVRDETGRTYAGADVRLDSLTLTAGQLAVAQAVASGAVRIDALALVAPAADEGTAAADEGTAAADEGTAAVEDGTAAAAELGCRTVIHADPSGAVRSVRRG